MLSPCNVQCSFQDIGDLGEDLALHYRAPSTKDRFLFLNYILGEKAQECICFSCLDPLWSHCVALIVGV